MSGYEAVRASGINPLWAMAESAYSDGTKWTRIWNHPINEGIRRKRGTPEGVQPGDSLWIPK